MSATNDKIRGNWNQLKGKAKEEYGQLTDNDLAYEEGQEDQLIGRLQEKLGKTKQEVKDWIDSL
ncbi:MAG: CsbD family protein [Bacteroidota bacterium]